MGCLFSSSVLCLCIDFSSILSPPSSAPFMMIPFSSLHFNVWSSPIYNSVPSSHFSPPHSALLFVSDSLLILSCRRLSAPCPVAVESRLGPSSVSGKVALQLAACPTRGLSLPGLATHTSAPPLPRLRHSAPAGSQLLDRHSKVNSSEGTRQIHPVSFPDNHEITVFIP